MKKSQKIKTDNSYNDCFIREVRVNYVATTTKPFRISGPDDVANFVRSILIDNSREHFVALYLDGSHRVASYAIVSIGSANQAAVHPREVFQRAVLVGATAIAIAHNHPSGDITPSNADREVTVKIRDAGKILGITVLDHVIITDMAQHSLREDSNLWND
jgi:DNA repair protein RadC